MEVQLWYIGTLFSLYILLVSKAENVALESVLGTPVNKSNLDIRRINKLSVSVQCHTHNMSKRHNRTMIDCRQTRT